MGIFGVEGESLESYGNSLHEHSSNTGMDVNDFTGYTCGYP